MSWVFFSFTMAMLFTKAHGSAVTMLQDKLAITCEHQEGSRSIKQVQVDARDTEIAVSNKDGSREAYAAIAFFDTALLAKKTDTQYALFHLYEDGRPVLVTGTIYDLRERECEDTGASKLCKGPGIEKLLWTSEKLELTVAGKTLATKVSRYGHFPNDGTYFYGFTGMSEKAGKSVLVLMDYGAKFQVLSGFLSYLSCKYEPVAAAGKKD